MSLAYLSSSKEASVGGRMSKTETEGVGATSDARLWGMLEGQWLSY